MSSQKKALNDLTVCPLFYASNVIQTFTFFKYDWSRLDIIDICEGKKLGGERERKKWPGQELLLCKPSIKQGLWRSQKKSQNFVVFSETHLQKNWPILREFCGKIWVKFCQKTIVKKKPILRKFSGKISPWNKMEFCPFLVRGKWWALISLCNNNNNSNIDYL